ncbi:hypothetical protein FEM21_01050 [Flavobacterium seoulense]|uniref:Uncharacterized protein n=1 Tax=Flavobacterium seoulense TaxID=1492738 RepID=A0A066WRB0_9FLAO|nr:hypothetical protein FEM21_01050 [Flavobacterium seoulense]
MFIGMHINKLKLNYVAFLGNYCFNDDIKIPPISVTPIKFVSFLLV